MESRADSRTKAGRRNEILEAAFEEFSARGYSGTSMEAIARRARASKETLYAWFENKETLFNTLLEFRMEGMLSRVALAAEVDHTPQHLLPLLAEDILRFSLASAPLSRTMGVGEATDRVLKRIGQTIQEERTRFAEYLLRCRDEGLLLFQADPMELASLFAAMAEGEWSLRMSLGLIETVSDDVIRAHARLVSETFLKGVGAR